MSWFPWKSRRSEHVYYQLFQRGSALPTRQAAQQAPSSKSTIGSVARLNIAPPQTVGSLQQCIAHLEGFEASDVAGVYEMNSLQSLPSSSLLAPSKGKALGKSAKDPISLIFHDQAARKAGIVASRPIQVALSSTVRSTARQRRSAYVMDGTLIEQPIY
ncbi:hypothetical protein DL93DRAFT_2234335 [Clavulina sp. PMI_390]|nr:hypothetical protein DL93DRAFT_2234335 [Clavulina sp. PMI_390]